MADRPAFGGRTVPGQAVRGLCAAAGVISLWIALHVAAVFLVDWTAWPAFMLAPVLMAIQAWLSVGLFIIAHDSMHGSLAPGRPAVNHAVGQVCLALYAGFSFTRLKAKHQLHHAHAGTDGDPDFDPAPPHGAVHWYLRFMVTYFGWREFVAITALFVAYVAATGADPLLVFVFWGIPSILASIQLFYFGTYLPHRPGREPFTDRHRSRSNEFSPLVSFLTCYHFGYHHEHHAYPFLPWWRLPQAHRGK